MEINVKVNITSFAYNTLPEKLAFTAQQVEPLLEKAHLNTKSKRYLMESKLAIN